VLKTSFALSIFLNLMPYSLSKITTNSIASTESKPNPSLNRGRVAMMSARSMQKAIDDSRLTQEQIQNIRTGISFGSTMGANESLVSIKLDNFMKDAIIKYNNIIALHLIQIQPFNR